MEQYDISIPRPILIFSEKSVQVCVGYLDLRQITHIYIYNYNYYFGLKTLDKNNETKMILFLYIY